MTTRDLASVAIKILGVYFVCIAVVVAFQAASMLVTMMIRAKDFTLDPGLAVAGTGWLPYALAGWACARYGDAIGARLFAAPSGGSLGIARIDLLTVGIAIVGVAFAFNEVCAIVGIALTEMWMEATRAPKAQTFPWDGLVAPLSIAAAGALLALNARKLASFLEARFDRAAT